MGVLYIILYNMTIFSVYPIEIITGEWGAIQILPVPCPPLIEIALYNKYQDVPVYCDMSIISTV